MSGSEDVLLTRICSVTAEDQTEATILQENQGLSSRIHAW